MPGRELLDEQAVVEAEQQTPNRMLTMTRAQTRSRTRANRKRAEQRVVFGPSMQVRSLQHAQHRHAVSERH